MPGTNEILDIPPARRVIGAALIVAMFVVALVAFFRPQSYDHLAAVNSPFLPSNAIIISLVAFACGCILSPFILYPCIYNRFPRWLHRYFSELQLKAMAKQFFGVTERQEL